MANTSTTTNQPAARGAERRPGECPPDHDLPENSKENLDTKLDHAIEETFPTSDPVSVNITKGGAIDYDREEAAAPSGGRSREAAGTAESFVNQAKDTLRDAAESVSGAARDAYDQSWRYIREAGSRYPEAGRYYREGSHAVSRSVEENPWLALLVAGAAGYALAWLIHGRSDTREVRVPDYARTRRGYAPRPGARERP